MEKKYFGYIRVSTKRQGNGASLREQKSAISAYAERNGLTVVRWFCETRTAAKAGRQQFNEMLGQLKRRRVAGVIIHKVDRSARNGHDWANVSDLVDLGIDVRFAHDDLDLTTRGGRLSADIQAVVAADFIRNNKEQVKLCMMGWVKDGYFPWPAPIGYLNSGKHKLKKIDPVRGPLVAQAFELYASGSFSIDTLRAELARWGLARKNGQPLPRNNVAVMLRNPFYVGVIRIRKTGETFEGKHEPLVRRKAFDRVQAILDGRVFPKTAQEEFRLRRLIRCGGCPRTLTAERQKGLTYYRCHSPSCRGVSLSEAEVERQHVIPMLDLLTFDEGEVGDIRDLATHLREREEAGEQSRVATFDLALGKVADRMQRLTDALLDGVLDEEAYRERKAVLLTERQRLTEAREESGPARFWQGVLERFELGNTALQLYLAGTDAEKREILISLGSNLVARGKDVVVSTFFPLSGIMNFRSVLNSAPYRAQVRTKRMSREEIEAMLLSIAQSVDGSVSSQLTWIDSARNAKRAERSRLLS